MRAGAYGGALDPAMPLGSSVRMRSGDPSGQPARPSPIVSTATEAIVSSLPNELSPETTALRAANDSPVTQYTPGDGWVMFASAIPSLLAFGSIVPFSRTFAYATASCGPALREPPAASAAPPSATTRMATSAISACGGRNRHERVIRHLRWGGSGTSPPSPRHEAGRAAVAGLRADPIRARTGWTAAGL